MKQLDKGKTKISLFVVSYLILSISVCILSADSIRPAQLPQIAIICAYAVISIIIALVAWVYISTIITRKVSQTDNYDLMDEQERKEEEEKKRLQMEKMQSQARAEQEKKMIAEKVTEIAEPIEDEVFPENYFDQLLINLSKTLNIVQGVAYTINRMEGKYEIKSTYAYYTTDTSRKFELGEGITGQVAKDQKILLLDTIPENYIHIVSGLGNSSPNNLLVIPVVYDDETIALLELASFEKPTMNLKEFFAQFNNKISAKVSDLLK